MITSCSSMLNKLGLSTPPLMLFLCLDSISYDVPMKGGCTAVDPS